MKKNDLVKMNLKGRIKSIFEKTLSIHYKDSVTNIVSANFNESGNITQKVFDVGNGYKDTAYFKYNNLNQCIGFELRSGRYVYKRDVAGNITETDIYKYQFDSLGHNIGDELFRIILDEYDLNGNMIREKDNDNISTYKYNKKNYITEMIDSPIAYGKVYPDKYITQYKYDTKGNLVEESFSEPDFDMNYKQWIVNKGYIYNKHKDTIVVNYYRVRDDSLVGSRVNTYTYDKQRNWITKVSIEDEIHIITITKRQIEYYSL